MDVAVQSRDGGMRHIKAEAGQTLLEALRKGDVTMFAPCSGAGTCGGCRILVHDRAGAGYRLACQTIVEDGMVAVPDDLGTLAVAGGDAAAASEQAVSGADDARFGLAVDIGTTTLALHLVDLGSRNIVASVGRVNPQVAFGGDVVARIGSASSAEGLEALCSALRDGLDDALAALGRGAGRDIGWEDLERVAVAGNTVMEHFAAGIGPEPIGAYPFAPPALFGEERRLWQADGRTGHPVRAYLAPAVAGYVGGDVTAGLHVAGLARSPKLQLYLDIGTNGEMALGSSGRIMCCATAAGPAFEGANIALGMPALRGAVSAVSIEDGELAVATVGGAEPVGICGSGLLDAVACLLDLGIVDETGRLLEAGEVGPRLAWRLGTEQEQRVCYLDAEKRVYLTQGDVRGVQLAKAAIRAGIDTLMDEMHVSYDDVRRIALAGGFGAHLSAASAARIGLLPAALEHKVDLLGNAAGKRAAAALFPEGRAALESVAASCSHVELSTSPTFAGLYLDAMGFEP
ncbi:MAG: DUF4445 domain-containing protein [Gordonibacter pamelaeae]|uniref:ASKHA domain-containing protein n=1 Tax=Gordonibacter pamelaeae TaxID=471189 RepID=UPI00242EE2F9|nr:ASKHA domain-containing protein [Gordonibacter pamelaeae]MBS4894920.1 DUF4445 domain-containing protein [Gordonibacter pamelaeae]